MNPDFSKYPDGLVPVIIQDDVSNKVLMLGYMNEGALARTRLEGKVTFFSRGRQCLWTKGETSGNHLMLKGIYIDCDRDCLLIKVSPAGPICHTGFDTCFGENNNSFSLEKLESIIADRKANPVAGSYTSALFEKGINKIAQKVGEEAVELVIEAKDHDDQRFLDEAGDLIYHYLILLQARSTRLEDVINGLGEKHKLKKIEK